MTYYSVNDYFGVGGGEGNILRSLLCDPHLRVLLLDARKIPPFSPPPPPLPSHHVPSCPVLFRYISVFTVMATSVDTTRHLASKNGWLRLFLHIYIYII